MKSEDACCLAKKHSQMNLGDREGCSAWPPWSILGQFLFCNLLKIRPGGDSFNHLCYRVCVGGMDQMGKHPNNFNGTLF